MRFPVPSRKFLLCLRGPLLISAMLGLLLLASYWANPSAGGYGLEVLSPSDEALPTAAPASQSAPSAPSVSATDNNNLTVYIASLSGEKYHARRDCPSLHSAQKIETLPLAEAEQKGYAPCTRCCGDFLPSS